MFIHKKVLFAFLITIILIAIFFVFTNFYLIEKIREIQKNNLVTFAQSEKSILSVEEAKILKINNDVANEIYKIKNIMVIFVSISELSLAIVFIFCFRNFYFTKSQEDIEIEDHYELKSNALTVSLKEISTSSPKRIWNKIAKEIDLSANNFLSIYPSSIPLFKIYPDIESEILNKIKGIDLETYRNFVSIYEKRCKESSP